MKRAKEGPAWKQFISKLNIAGYEIFPRQGNPIPMKKKGEPMKPENIYMIFFARRGEKFTKKQEEGMKFWRALGFKIFKYPPKPIIFGPYPDPREGQRGKTHHGSDKGQDPGAGGPGNASAKDQA